MHGLIVCEDGLDSLMHGLHGWIACMSMDRMHGSIECILDPMTPGMLKTRTADGARDARDHTCGSKPAVACNASAHGL